MIFPIIYLISRRQRGLARKTQNSENITKPKRRWDPLRTWIQRSAVELRTII